MRTSLSVAIKAPAALVWSVPSGIARWPSWQPDIQETALVGPPGTGSAFRWTVPGGTIHSRIELFEPGRRLSWIGRVMVFHAIHVWTLESLPNGDTELSTRETLSDWPITLFYSSDLRQTDRRWLDSLRREAERLEAISAGRSTHPTPDARGHLCAARTSQTPIPWSF